MYEISFADSSDTSVSVVFGNSIDEETNVRVMNFFHHIKREKINGITELCPSYCSLSVGYNPLVISRRKILSKLKRLSKSVSADIKENSVLWKIPVCYGGEYGEDLSDTASILGMSEKELIELHCSAKYRIYMLGFLPGFAYLGGMNEKIIAPRLKEPRIKIPCGSVGIGGSQTGIYPLESPGGWRLIGRTPVKVYDSTRSRAVLYSAGNYIQFVPINKDEYERIDGLVQKGEYEIENSFIGR